MKKACTKCKIEFDETSFYRTKRTKDGFQAWCKKCHYAYQTTPEYRAKQNAWHAKRWRDQDGFYRNKHLVKTFGVTIEQYNEILVSQGGVCAICSKLPGCKRTDHLAVDHNHATGKIRGLLCASCNRALGFLCENPDIAATAAAYLRKHEGDFQPLTFVA